MTKEEKLPESVPGGYCLVSTAKACQAELAFPRVVCHTRGWQLGSRRPPGRREEGWPGSRGAPGPKGGAEPPTAQEGAPTACGRRSGPRRVTVRGTGRRQHGSPCARSHTDSAAPRLRSRCPWLWDRSHLSLCGLGWGFGERDGNMDPGLWPVRWGVASAGPGREMLCGPPPGACAELPSVLPAG